jgi:tetratricopeptide (TPR) repeat protein
VENGIKLLGSLVAKENPSPLAVFHYARLLWEKGRIAHASGNKQGGIALYHQALERFQPLAAHHHGELRTEHVLRHMGYLHSEIGHASQLEKNMDQARQGFSASLAIWQDLLRQHPQHQEYRELRDWCQSRLKEL